MEEEYVESRSHFTGETMRKQELVHIHGLLVEITQSLVDQGTVSAEVWNEYKALDISAYSIHAQKSDHEEAVLLLATTLRAALDPLTEGRSAISIP
ncbi:UPF0058 family protein [Haloplanus pelagicus]|uniref:UPF0058 family protein n=1 Tax=Haloplanus pelagicus TaxID=2949995 RepID=UPI00203BC96F|nr:UPF0058 family protein [Haloplanus sp. HW8-1]